MITAPIVVGLASFLFPVGSVEPGAAPADPAGVVPEVEPGAKRDKPLARGERVPAFTLKNADGKPVRLSEQLAAGPVVVTFYRGTWCPYCVKALGSVEESVAEINRLGARVLAISPQTPDQAIDLRERLGLSYELLVDSENRLADRLGLMFTLDEATIEKYRDYGIDVGAANGSDEWQLPIPATFVVDKDGIVRYAWTEEDYTKRAPASDVLKTLRELASE